MQLEILLAVRGCVGGFGEGEVFSAENPPVFCHPSRSCPSMKKRENRLNEQFVCGKRDGFIFGNFPQLGVRG